MIHGMKQNTIFQSLVSTILFVNPMILIFYADHGLSILALSIALAHRSLVVHFQETRP